MKRKQNARVSVRSSKDQSSRTGRVYLLIDLSLSERQNRWYTEGEDYKCITKLLKLVYRRALSMQTVCHDPSHPDDRITEMNNALSTDLDIKRIPHKIIETCLLVSNIDAYCFMTHHTRPLKTVQKKRICYRTKTDSNLYLSSKVAKKRLRKR